MTDELAVSSARHKKLAKIPTCAVTQPLELPKIMTLHMLEQEQRLPITLDAAWEFFSSPRNLDEITPDALGFKIVSLPGEKMYEGQIITYKVKILPGIWVPWVTEIKAVDEGKSFVDEQRFGPYQFWHHRHSFEEMPTRFSSGKS
jgi:ligand-binding SRPBCC domain-containing protein